MIDLIQPMAGRGSRFESAGFDVPKPLIPLLGKPFFYWAIESLRASISLRSLTCVLLEEHVQKHGLDRQIKEVFPEAQCLVLPDVLEGPTLTTEYAVRYIPNLSSFIVNDCDHAFKASALTQFLTSCDGDIKSVGCDGGLLTFESDNPAYSYVELNADDAVVRTVEKQVVSQNAICGAYLFSSPQHFMDCFEQYKDNCEYDELFMSGLYNEGVRLGGAYRIFSCDYHVPFGVPNQFELATQRQELLSWS